MIRLWRRSASTESRSTGGRKPPLQLDRRKERQNSCQRPLSVAMFTLRESDPWNASRRRRKFCDYALERRCAVRSNGRTRGGERDREIMRDVLAASL